MFGSQSAYGGYSNSYGNAQPPPPSNTPHYYNHHSNPPPPTDNYDSRAHSNHHHRSDDFRQGLDGGELESGLAQLAVDTNHNNHNNDKDFPQLSGGGSFSTRVSKPSSWASVASQPVKSTPKLLKTKMAVAQGLLTGNSKHLPPTVVVAINSFDTKNGPSKVPPQAPPTQAVPPTGAAPLQSDSPPPQPPQPSQAQAQASREQEPSPGKDDLNDSSEDERSSWNTEMQKHERMNVQQYEREREMAQEKRNDYRDGPRSAPPPIHNQNRGDPRDHQGMTNGGHQQKPAQVYKLRPYDPSTMPPINQHPAQQPYHPGPRSQDRDVDHHHQGYHHQRDQPHHPRDDNYRDGGYGGRPNNYNNNRRDYDGRGGGDNQYQNYRHQNHQNHSGDGGYQNRRYQNPQPYEKANSYQSQQSREDRMERMANPVVASPGSVKSEASNDTSNTHPVLEKLICENNYNPEKFELQLQGARFFIIKSFSEDDVHRSIKYSIWCSTEHGNKRLDTAFRDQMDLGPIYLFFSVNRSGHFCGVAEMKSEVDYRASSGVWSQDKWKGQFQVRWVYVKDVPNDVLRHITLENNEGKPVTNSRDTQEVPSKQGKEVVSIIHHYKHSTSIFDDFPHYEQKQEKEAPPPLPPQAHGLGPHNPPPPPHGQQSAPRDGPMNPMPRDGQADRRRASSPPPLTGPGSGFDRRDRQQNNYGNYQNNNGGAGGRGGYDNQSRPDRNMNYNQQGRGGRAYDNNNGYQPRNNDHYQARSNDGYQRNGNDGYDNRQRNTDGGYQSNRGNYNGGAHNNHMQRDRNAGPNDGYQGQRSQDGGYSNSNAAPAGRPEGYQPRDGGYERRPQRNNDHFRRNNDPAHLERESWRN